MTLTSVAAWFDVAWIVGRRTWIKTLRRPVALTFSLAQPLVWMAFFGFLFERYQVPSPGGTVYPGDTVYLDFLAPGVCAMTVLFGASQSGIGWVRDLRTGFLPRMLNTPASPDAILAGKIAADVVRLLLQAAVVLVLALGLGVRFSPSWTALPSALLCLAFFAAAMSSLSCAIALRTRTQEVMGAFVHLVNMPLLFTSTALVPARQMPDWLEGLARWNPLTLAVDAWRDALIFADSPTLIGQLLPLTILAMLLYGLAAVQIRAVSSLYGT